MSLSGDQKNLAQQSTAARNKTTDYLDRVEDPLAQGQGGYNAEEKQGIQLSPQQQQDMVTGAGISAGVGTAAATDAATRAANAVGGNPAALATYRARAAQTGAGAAGDASTQARIAASNTAANREEAIGGARMGQQDQALSYYSGLEGQQNQNAENAYGRQVQSASMPNTFDKIIGAAGGALSKLADGTPGGGGGTLDAVIGEDGPERVVDTRMMDEGFDPDSGDPVSSPSMPTPGAAPGGGVRPWFRSLGQRMKQNPQQPQPSAARPAPWSPVDTYRTIGEGVGSIAKAFTADGTPPQQGANGVFTQPTEVKLDPRRDAVVPLSYRPNARARPSMAMLPAARQRPAYGA